MKQKKKNIALSLIIVVLLALLAVAAIIVVRLLKGNAGEEAADVTADGIIAYESNLITDEASLQDAVDDLIEKAKEGQMALEMRTEAISRDGKTFQCYLANSAANNYDMYMVFYDDETQDEIYRTGLIPVGSRIETFTLEEKLKTGNHEITIVFNQVESDRQTVHAQVNVGLTLIVQ